MSFNRSDFVEIGSARSAGQFEAKDTFRISCSHRDEDGDLPFLYVRGPMDWDWEYAVPLLKKVCSQLLLERCSANTKNVVKVRGPSGTNNYPQMHIRPRGFSVKTFEIIDVKCIIDGKNLITLIIPTSIRKKFS